MASILSLFSDAEMKGLASMAAPVVCSEPARRAVASAPSVSVLLEPARPQVVEVVDRLGSEWVYVLDPCVQCRYLDICDGDYCAMLVHPVDMPHAPSERGWRYYGL